MTGKDGVTHIPSQAACCIVPVLHEKMALSLCMELGESLASVAEVIVPRFLSVMPGAVQQKKRRIERRGREQERKREILREGSGRRVLATNSF